MLWTRLYELSVLKSRLMVHRNKRDNTMTSEQFVYWLQGFMEIGNPKALSAKETQIVKDHLKLVFDKKTPDYTFAPGTTIPNITDNNQVIC